MFPERRRHMRIVTIRNFGWLTIALLIAFAVFTVRSEFRGRNMQNYGRLVNRQIQTDVERKPVETVQEVTPAPTIATPPQPVAPPQPMVIVPADPSAQAPVFGMQGIPMRGDSPVAIVGGAGGVTVVQQVPRRRVLRGGFGR